LPINQKIILDIYFKLGRFVEKQLTIRLPKKGIRAQYHHWELEYGRYNTKLLLNNYQDIGYICSKQFRFRLQNYFFFELE
jgi:hypothetical protein